MEHKVLKRYPLGNKRFIWKQKDYVISTFSGFPEMGTQEGDIDEVADKYAKYHKEAHFNLMELGWVEHEGSWAAVDACENNGIDLIFQDMSIMGGMQHHHIERKVPYEVVEDVVNKLKDKKHTIGYYVWDEPCSVEQMDEARRQMDMLQKADPEALHFTVGLPNYNGGDENGPHTWERGTFEPYVRRFAEKLDPPVMSFDYYPVGDYFNVWPGHTYSFENQLDDTFMWLDMALYRQVAKEMNVPFWFYYQGYKLYKCTKEEDFIFPMVRAFMYAGVLYGAKGLQNYATGEKGNRFLNPDGSKGDFYEEQKKINFEIKNLGKTLMALDSKLIIHSDDLLPDCEYTKPYFNKVEESKIFAGTLPKRCSIGELEDEYGNTYAVILNRDYEKTVEFNLELNANFRVYEVSKDDGKHRVINDGANEITVKLNPGDAVLYRFQKSSEEAFTIEYELAE